MLKTREECGLFHEPKQAHHKLTGQEKDYVINENTLIEFSTLAIHELIIHNVGKLQLSV